MLLFKFKVPQFVKEFDSQVFIDRSRNLLMPLVPLAKDPASIILEYCDPYFLIEEYIGGATDICITMHDAQNIAFRLFKQRNNQVTLSNIYIGDIEIIPTYDARSFILSVTDKKKIRIKNIVKSSEFYINIPKLITPYGEFDIIDPLQLRSRDI